MDLLRRLRRQRCASIGRDEERSLASDVSRPKQSLLAGDPAPDHVEREQEPAAHGPSVAKRTGTSKTTITSYFSPMCRLRGVGESCSVSAVRLVSVVFLHVCLKSRARGMRSHSAGRETDWPSSTGLGLSEDRGRRCHDLRPRAARASLRAPAAACVRRRTFARRARGGAPSSPCSSTSPRRIRGTSRGSWIGSATSWLAGRTTWCTTPRARARSSSRSP